MSHAHPNSAATENPARAPETQEQQTGGPGESNVTGRPMRPDLKIEDLTPEQLKTVDKLAANFGVMRAHAFSRAKELGLFDLCSHAPAPSQDAAPALGEDSERLVRVKTAWSNHQTLDESDHAWLLTMGTRALKAEASLAALSPAQVAPVDGGGTPAGVAGVPVVADASRILATAIWDATNTNRLSEIDDEEQSAAVARAEGIRGWLRVLGFDVQPNIASHNPGDNEGHIRNLRSIKRSYDAEGICTKCLEVAIAALARPAPQAPAASAGGATRLQEAITETLDSAGRDPAQAFLRRTLAASREKVALAPTAKPEPSGREEVDIVLFKHARDCLTKAERDEIRDAILAARPVAEGVAEKPLERVRHVKRGTEYEVLGEAEAQVSTFDGWVYGGYKRLRDGMRLTLYRCVETGKLWCRFTDEFRDGRFVPATAPATPSEGGQ